MSTYVGQLDAARFVRPKAVAGYGFALGVVAFLAAIPPITVRSPVWPVLLGICAAFAGVFAASRGARRAGWGAVVVGVLGVGLGVLATRSSTGDLDQVFTASLIASMLVFATPLTFGAIGGMFSERSGVVNIGLEGMMLMGAFWGIWGADKTGSWVGGLVIGIISGGLLAVVHAIFAIHLRADQIVGGVAVNFLALGITGYMFIDIYGDQGTPANVSMVPDVSIPGIRSLPGVLGVFGSLNLMVWLLFLAIVVVHVVLFRTPIGLRIRSVGEHPRAADTVGISVYGIRYAAVIVSGMLAALGGAYLSIGFVGSFDQNMTAGRGFIALAAMIFGKWRPYGAFGACLLFGFASGLADRLQQSANVSVNLLSTLPYVLTLIALVGLIGRSRPPAADGRPYIKE